MTSRVERVRDGVDTGSGATVEVVGSGPGWGLVRTGTCLRGRGARKHRRRHFVHVLPVSVGTPPSCNVSRWARLHRDDPQGTRVRWFEVRHVPRTSSDLPLHRVGVSRPHRRRLGALFRRCLVSGGVCPVTRGSRRGTDGRVLVLPLLRHSTPVVDPAQDSDGTVDYSGGEVSFPSGPGVLVDFPRQPRRTQRMTTGTGPRLGRRVRRTPVTSFDKTVVFRCLLRLNSS